MKLNEKVCKLGTIHGVLSPLCNDRKQYADIDRISKEHGLDMEVLIGISYAESHIGTNFAPSQDCNKMNNWAGIKSKKKDDGTSIKYKLPYSGCRLYPFQNMTEFWKSLANTISMGYVKGGCNNLRCLSSWYVGSPGKPKLERVARVEKFVNYDK